MTHRVYTDEYNEKFIYQLSHNNIKGLFTTDESTEKVLVVSGELEDLEKLASLMYKDEQKCKEVFPSFLLESELENDCTAMLKNTLSMMQNELIKVINKYHNTAMACYSNKDYKRMMEAFEILDPEFAA